LVSGLLFGPPCIFGMHLHILTPCVRIWRCIPSRYYPAVRDYRRVTVPNKLWSYLSRSMDVKWYGLIKYDT